MKRLLAMLLAMLMLVLPMAQAEEALPDMAQLSSLLDALTDTLHGQELASYVAGAEDAPSTVAYGLIWRLLYRGLIPAQVAEDGAVSLSEGELKALYDQLFAAGTFVLPAEDCCEMITRTSDGLRFDVSTAATECAGLQVMLVSEGSQPDTQNLLCETYVADMDWSMVDDEALTSANWSGVVLVEVQRDEQAPFGWRIVSYSPADETDAGGSVG